MSVRPCVPWLWAFVSGWLACQPAPSIPPSLERPNGPELPFSAGAPDGTRPFEGGCRIPERTAGRYDVAPAFPGLVTPGSYTAVVRVPGSLSEWYLVERPGRILRFDEGAGSGELEVVLDLREQTETHWDAGMMGAVFHPRFPERPELFVSYTRKAFAGSVSRVSRFELRQGRIDPESEEVLIAIPQEYDVHQAAGMAFGPDGLLYLGFGDGGISSTAQDPFELRGKVLRLDVDGARPYAIPLGNPYFFGGGAPEVYASGFRNPWRFSFDSHTGELWLGDVGLDHFEEINVVVRGGNYGWPLWEGGACHLLPCDPSPYEGPVYSYPHRGNASVTGGYVYRGGALPALFGRYLFADFITGELWALTDSGREVQAEKLVDTGKLIVSFSERSDGELQILTYTGEVLDLVSAVGSPEGMPLRLSDLTCFTAGDPKSPQPWLVPYRIKTELWSDGAEKRRWFTLPPGGALRWDASGDVEFPVGSVLFKEFSLGERRLETRVLARHARDWTAATYVWDEAGDDAFLTLDGATLESGERQFEVPSQAQCFQCHTQAAGRSLGPSLFQWKDLEVESGTGTELSRLASLQLFESSPSEGVEPLPLVEREQAARSYLHVNCSHCHRPGGPGRGGIDLRWNTPLESTGVCDAPPSLGELGVEGARLIHPGHPERSVLLLRMMSLSDSRMPPLGSHRVDEVGVETVAAWIRALEACPQRLE